MPHIKDDKIDFNCPIFSKKYCTYLFKNSFHALRGLIGTVKCLRLRDINYTHKLSVVHFVFTCRANRKDEKYPKKKSTYSTTYCTVPVSHTYYFLLRTCHNTVVQIQAKRTGL